MSGKQVRVSLRDRSPSNPKQHTTMNTLNALVLDTTIAGSDMVPQQFIVPMTRADEESVTAQSLSPGPNYEKRDEVLSRSKKVIKLSS